MPYFKMENQSKYFMPIGRSIINSRNAKKKLWKTGKRLLTLITKCDMLLTVETHVESVSVDFYQKGRRK